MQCMKWEVFAAALLWSLVPPAVRAGVVFEIESQNHASGRPAVETITVQADGQFLKFQPRVRSNQVLHEIIYRGDQRRMLVVDHSSQSYMILDQQAMQKMVSQINQSMAQVGGQFNSAMESLPPQQRALATQLINGGSGAFPQSKRQSPVTVHPLQNQERVYGYPSVLVEVRRDARKVRHLWITDWKNVAGAEQLAPLFADLATFHEELIQSLPTSGGLPGAMTDHPFSELNKLRGFPVATREYHTDGSVISESALRGVTSRTLSPADFAPPANYRQQALLSR